MVSFVVLSRISPIESFASTTISSGHEMIRPQNQIHRKSTTLSVHNYKNDNEVDSRLGRAEPPNCVLKQRNPYDVHVYYSTPDERAAAMELRKRLQTSFPWMRFYQPKDRPIGPHPFPMWEADFGGYENRHEWKAVRDFLLNHNPGNLSILIHPHSLDGDYADHTEHAFWAGKVLELRIRGWKR
jgi:DOPA 4,5-dioxygenase